MHKAILCLGSNLGIRRVQLERAKYLLQKLAGNIAQQSGYYETAAWGNSTAYAHINQCLVLETHLSPLDLLRVLLKIEKRLGRKRGGEKNDNRLIDIDILFYEDVIIDSKALQLPHPRLHLRRFVLTPLKELIPHYKHPVLKKSILALDKLCTDKLAVVPYSLKPIYIGIEGNIGSGKTTLAKALAKQFGTHFLPEQFEDNALLPLFYTSPKIYAFPLEYSFLIQRFQQLHAYFKSQKDITIADFSLYKCLLFAKVNLPKKEFAFYATHFKAIAKQVPQPDAIIVLHTQTAHLKHNIKERGRIYEQSIPKIYLDNVSALYKKDFQKVYKGKLIHLEISSYEKNTLNSLIAQALKSLSL